MSTLIEETVASAEAAQQPETGDGMRKMAQIVGGGMIAAAAGLTFAGRANAQAITDADILNFALNLEYLEAEFYLAAVGRQPSYGVTGAGTQGTVTGGRAVNFTTSEIRQYAEEIAADEEAHVRFLRQALGSAAVARPAINFTDAFNAAARLAFNNQSATFDPFANELFFLHGAFVFEDVGVTAYKGAARLLTNAGNLAAAAGILAVEAYHAANIRTTLFRNRDVNAPGIGLPVSQIVEALSNLRDAADGPADLDQGILLNGQANIVPTDENGIAFSRTAAQVLRIVYLAPTAAADRGGFFPNGLNGAIRSVQEGQFA